MRGSQLSAALYSSRSTPTLKDSYLYFLLMSEALVSSVATKVSRALNFTTTNLTIGRDLVRAALRSSTVEEFEKEAGDYGSSEFPLFMRPAHPSTPPCSLPVGLGATQMLHIITERNFF